MNTIPAFGLGTWKIPKEIAEDVVYQAISKCEVRHIDCACDYGNEKEVGKGEHACIFQVFNHIDCIKNSEF